MWRTGRVLVPPVGFGKVVLSHTVLVHHLARILQVAGESEHMLWHYLERGGGWLLSRCMAGRYAEGGG